MKAFEEIEKREFAVSFEIEYISKNKGESEGSGSPEYFWNLLQKISHSRIKGANLLIYPINRRATMV